MGRKFLTNNLNANFGMLATLIMILLIIASFAYTRSILLEIEVDGQSIEQIPFVEQKDECGLGELPTFHQLLVNLISLVIQVTLKNAKVD